MLTSTRLRRLRAGCYMAALLPCSSGCLSQSYQIDAPELQRLVSLPARERGDRVRVTQQTALGSDTSGMSHELDAADWALLIASDSSDPDDRFADSDDDDDDDVDVDDSAEDAMATAVVALAAAATAAVTIGVTEGLRYDGWVQASPEQPVLLVDAWGKRRWARLGTLTPDQVRNAERAVFPDFADDLRRLERHPLDRAGFVYQLELGTEPAPFDGLPLAFSARGALGFMPEQHYGFLLGAAFSSADSDAPPSTLRPSTSFDHRVFVQAEAWPLSAGRWHLGPYAELGYAWARADEPLGTRHTDGWMLALGAALQLEWSTRLALTLRAGAAYLPSLDPHGPLATADHRLAPAVTVGFSIY